MPEKMKKMETAAPGVMMKMDLRLGMRKLWEDHIVYTRNYIISALAGLGDADAVAQRLLKNQDDIGDAIKPFSQPRLSGRSYRSCSLSWRSFWSACSCSSFFGEYSVSTHNRHNRSISRGKSTCLGCQISIT